MLGLRSGLLRDTGHRLADWLLGLGLLYWHRLWEDLFGEAFEEPCSRALPHLEEERQKMKTWQLSTTAPILMNANFPLCSLPSEH